MAFEKLQHWTSTGSHIDPRLTEKYSTGSKHCVVSVTRYPTYRELQQYHQSVADSKLVGVIQSLQAPQSRPIQRFFELGSKHPYAVPGRFMGSLTMSSILFDAGCNIIGAIFEESMLKKGIHGGPLDGEMTPSGKELLNRPLLFDDGVPVTYKYSDVGGTDGEIRKNFGAIRMSLDDNRLDAPFGLIMTIFQSAKRIKATGQDPELTVNTNDDYSFRAMACLFFEMCRLEQYSFDLNAQQELIGEFARFYFTGLVNVKTTLQTPDTGGEGRTGFE